MLEIIGSVGSLKSRDGRVTWPVRTGAAPAPAGGFSAREELAADLDATLIAGTAAALIPARAAGEPADVWLRSRGKTQFAVRVAESMWRSGRLDLLIWITATSRARVLSGYAEAAEQVLGADPDGKGELIAARFAGWLGQTPRTWLVVFDDLRDGTDLDGLWPAGPAGRILITTANPGVVPDHSPVLIRQIGIFSPPDALGLLTHRLSGSPGKYLGAARLTADLGYEPLAIAQAHAVIAASAMSCREYGDCFARRLEQITQADGSRPTAARVTWAMSAEHAGQLTSGDAAQALLAFAAVLDGNGIPGAVFATMAAREYLAGASDGEPADSERASETLSAARQTGLLLVDPGPGALVRLSAAVQAAARAAGPTGLLEQAGRAAADALLQSWPPDERPIWLASALRSCAVSLRRATGDLLWDGGCHPLLLRTGRSLDRAHLTGPAVAYWSGLAADSDRILGHGHPNTLDIGEQLASAYLAAGQADQAAGRFGYVLAERVRVLGPDHPRAIADRRDLGHALVAANRLSEAVKVLDRAVGDYSRVRGADQPETLAAQDELGAAFHAAGQFADAIRAYRNTLVSRERMQGPEHPDAIATRLKLAGAYLADGEFKTAISHYKHALSDRERVLGTDHLETIAVRGELGAAHYSAGRMALALQLYGQARSGYALVLGTDHPDTLAASATLAQAYYDVGRVTDATTLLGDTLRRCIATLPSGDPLTLAVRERLTAMSRG